MTGTDWSGHDGPGHATLGTPPPGHPRCMGPRSHACLVPNSAMGSKMALRNSRMDPDMDLRLTIWALATFLVPCCKNPLSSKAPDYLRLSNPYPPGSRTWDTTLMRMSFSHGSQEFSDLDPGSQDVGISGSRVLGCQDW